MRLIEDLTQSLVDWAQMVRSKTPTEFEAARELVTRMGMHQREDGHAEVGYWTPALADKEISAEDVYLEVLTPQKPLDLRQPSQQMTFKRERVNLMQDGQCFWGVIEGLTPGTREQIGSFYWLAYKEDDEWHHIVDPLAYSVPFGVLAPSEFYDVRRLDRERADREHFQNLPVESEIDEVVRVKAPANILQIHIGTASEAGTLEGLTAIYEEIGRKVEAGEDLSAAEKNFIGYDTVQLMPIEPTIEYEGGPLFWNPQTDTPTAESVTVELQRPDMTNWGYDVMIAGSPATNPVLLGSGRPDELVDFIAALHNFPNNPIGVIFDIVYGHADNQALPVLSDYFFAGPNMYGQNLAYRHPVVRAMLLEMQRRKSNFGVDGLRVDGAQDFKFYMDEAEAMVHDDEYLRLMNDLVQHVAGVEYRPWMIFEDGRPWPRDDWELASSYLEVTKYFPNVFQWGPLTFAHNTPFRFTFWIGKWWRLREVAEVGQNWITGCANHDTLRRGTQVDLDVLVNTYLGETLPEIFKNAYDNPAANLLNYGFLPGVTMDFINALMRAPWSFIRNTDERWGVKVISEEAHFLDWAVDEAHYQQPEHFTRLKEFGFSELHELRRFLRTLDNLVKATDYNLYAIVDMMNAMTPALPLPALTPKILKSMARAWMDDVYDYCNVSQYEDHLDATKTDFNLHVREFRQRRRWMIGNLRKGDHFDYLHPLEGTVLYYGLRTAPDESEQVLCIVNSEGTLRTITPATLPIENLVQTGWEITLVTPHTDVLAFDQPLTLGDSQGVIFTRQMD
jgi:hypothetical protein